MKITPIATPLAAVLCSAALLMAPALAQAETATKKLQPAAAAKTQVKPKLKSTAYTKPKPGKAGAKSKARPSAKAKTSSRSGVKVAKTAAPEKLALLSRPAAPVKSPIQNVASGLGPAELAIAERVHVGYLPCELGASVTLTADPRAPGYFNMQGKNFSYRMSPVQTSTGAIRLEDPKAGVVWLQLANKSMLMNQKQGVRLADECTSQAQLTMAQALKIQPATSILEPLTPAQPVPGEFSRPVPRN